MKRDDLDERLATWIDELLQQPSAARWNELNRIARENPSVAVELRELFATAVVAEGLAPELWGSNPLSATLDSPAFAASSKGERSFPRSFGSYVLLEELGRGGMGVVYKAEQTRPHRIVALKMILRAELATAVDRARFRAETEAGARLEHPHIVSVYEVGEIDERPYFSMQYIEGSTLARRLADGPLPPREAANLLIPVCRAIAHAHRQGVLHRDLKPSNILLDMQGKPFVTDFGLAKRLIPDEEERAARRVEMSAMVDLTHSGAILGTPGYLAPEQAAGGRQRLTPATDVFSLGAVLYATLTGQAPFRGSSPVESVFMVLEQDPPPARLFNPKADADLEMIAIKALQKPPDLRYADPDALANDLEAYLKSEPISARSSHISQILSRALRPTHHAAVLENWGLLWMWHALVLLLLCLLTNGMQLSGVTSRLPYLGLWTLGLGAWAIAFWTMRRRAGPVTFVERQIAHVWAAAMGCSTMLFGVESLLNLPVLKLSPILALLAAAVFVVKAGILSGEFYIPAAVLFLTSLPMSMYPRYGLTIFGIVSAATFFIPGWKFHRQRPR